MNGRILLRSAHCLVIVVLMLACSLTVSAQAKTGSGPDRKLDTPFASFRAGLALAPEASVDVGLDVSFPQVRLFGKSWFSRGDVDLTARLDSPSFGSRRDGEAAISLCQVYAPMGANRGRYFIGAGIGPSFGHRNGIGGKLFVGMNFSSVVSVEADAQFPPGASLRAALMVRLSAL